MQTNARQIILVVEDDVALAEFLHDTLAAQPAYQAVVVSDGAQALAALRQAPVALILLDLGLPDLDGAELYSRLQADPALCTIPVLFLTGSPEDARLPGRHRAPVLGKPFDLNVLLAVIGNLLDSP